MNVEKIKPMIDVTPTAKTMVEVEQPETMVEGEQPDAEKMAEVVKPSTGKFVSIIILFHICYSSLLYLCFYFLVD